MQTIGHSLPHPSLAGLSKTKPETDAAPTSHPRPWHRNSQFGDAPRMPLCRERRTRWKARLEICRRTGQLTDGASYVGLALLKRLGQDGRCDPSHKTLAADSGESVSTVKRALKAFHACGLVSWVRRLVRSSQRVTQISNAYQLTLGDPPKIPGVRCEGQSDRQTSSLDKSRDILSTVAAFSAADRTEAKAVLADRQKVTEDRLLKAWQSRRRFAP